MLGWLFGKATGTVVEKVGDAIHKNVRAIRGDRAEEAAAIADEQLAVLSEHASEFVSRPDRTWWDSLWDGINRAPRPLVVFYVLGVMVWPFFSPESFMRYALSLELLPDEMYQLFLIVLSLYFGSRVISSDLKAPRMSPEQKKKALEVIASREQIILENRKPLIVEVAPTRKPPPPPWAAEKIAEKPKFPVIKPEIGKPQETIKGRPVEVDKMIAEIIRKEGGYVNDPSDSGGPTNMGITQATLSGWRQEECSIEDVKKLTREEAAEIYRTQYYFAPGIDSLPIGLQPHVTDIGVNCGPRTGVKMLQQALNILGSDIKEDGIIGPMTRDACNIYDLAKIHNTLVDVRIKFYENLAVRSPKNKKFLAGWKKRAKSFMV